jgi:hypothetical protein
VQVPEAVAELVVTLCANGQTDATDVAEFEKVRLAKFAR